MDTPVEPLRVVDRGDEGGGGDGADVGDRAQARHARILDGEVLDRRVGARELPVEVRHDGEERRDHREQAARQGQDPDALELLLFQAARDASPIGPRLRLDFDVGVDAVLGHPAIRDARPTEGDKEKAILFKPRAHDALALRRRGRMPTRIEERDAPAREAQPRRPALGLVKPSGIGVAVREQNGRRDALGAELLPELVDEARDVVAAVGRVEPNAPMPLVRQAVVDRNVEPRGLDRALQRCTAGSGRHGVQRLDP
jgi:hypothetical protein